MSGRLGMIVLSACFVKSHQIVIGHGRVTISWDFTSAVNNLQPDLCTSLKISCNFLPLNVTDFRMQILTQSDMPIFMYSEC